MNSYPRWFAGWSMVAIYVSTIVLANWAITRYGIVPVGFGLVAPAGVYFAGIAFTARDLIQDTIGRYAVVAAILIGALLSYDVSSGKIAIASAVAFLASETADFAVYTPLRERGWLKAVVASNIVGLVVDSWLFLTIAFGSTAFIWGQIVGKLWVTSIAVLVLSSARYGWRLRTA